MSGHRQKGLGCWKGLDGSNRSSVRRLRHQGGKCVEVKEEAGDNKVGRQS